MSALFATIAVVHLLALMSPGPDFLFVTRTAVSQSRSRAMLGVLGITTGVVFWAGLSILGLQVIFHTVPWLQSFITVAGGLYLIWMGYQLLKSGLSTPAQTSGASAEKGAAGQEEAKGVKTMRHPFLFGLLTNLANPKVVIYFASIFSGLVTPDTSDVVRTTIFAMVILETFLWFGVVALIFGLEPLRRGYRRLCRCNGDRKDRKEETLHLTGKQIPVENRKVDVYRIQDQFDGEQYRNQITTRNEAVHPSKEHYGADHQIVLHLNFHSFISVYEQSTNLQ